jgi:mannose-6-phosphate isomerase-like protein (cupin superfamily)
MNRVQIQFKEGFDIVAGNERSQSATMVLSPGTSTGGPNNKHPNSDQWLYVISGEGVAVVEGEQLELKTGTLVLVEKGETHEIRNTGTRPLETINFYVPPAY